MLYGSVQAAPGLFQGRHVPVDGARLRAVPPAAQQLQSPLALSQGLQRPALSPVQPSEQTAETGDKPWIQTRSYSDLRLLIIDIALGSVLAGLSSRPFFKTAGDALNPAT